MATKTKTDTEQAAAIAAYEESLKQSASTNVTLALAMRELFRECGFTYIDDSGEEPMEKLDNEGIKEGIYKISTRDLVGSAKDREDKPVHRYSLTGGLLTKYPIPPSAEYFAQDALRIAAWTKADQEIWKQVDHKPSATIQRWIRERKLGEGLCLVKSGDYVFVTGEPSIIRAEVLKPLTDKAEVQMISAGEQFGLFEQQCQALKPGNVRALKAANKRMGEKALAAYTLKASAAQNGGNGDDGE